MDHDIKLFRATLKQNGHFITKPRLHFFKTLQGHNTLSIDELIRLLRSEDQSTVYRNIKLFEELGIINRLRLGWNSKIELSDMFHHHHHHLTCLSCGAVAVLDENPTIEKQINFLSRQQGFEPNDHQLEIRGRCRNCH